MKITDKQVTALYTAAQKLDALNTNTYSDLANDLNGLYHLLLNYRYVYPKDMIPTAPTIIRGDVHLTEEQIAKLHIGKGTLSTEEQTVGSKDKNIISDFMGIIYGEDYSPPIDVEDYDFVKPQHYMLWESNGDTLEVLEKVLGIEGYLYWLKGTILKYQLRLGKKPGESPERDTLKIKFYQDEYKRVLGIYKENTKDKINELKTNLNN